MNYTDQAAAVLKELLAPIPFFVRGAARKMMEKDILETAQAAGHDTIQVGDVLRGYVAAGVKKGTDKEKIKQVFVDKGYDLAPYQDLLA